MQKIENRNPIEKVKGPCVILAGAGTGKTYTIVEKVKYLIENKICSPEKVVCITFSNEAANNLLMRVERMFEFEQGKEPIVKTFHAFSADLLRKYGSFIGVKEDFKVLEPDDAKVILHKNFKIGTYYCHKYVDTIGSCKDLGISLESLQEYLNKELRRYGEIELEKKLDELQFELQTLHLKKNNEDKREIMYKIYEINRLLGLKKFINAWNAYEKLKLKNNYQDYSDLNRNALTLLKTKTEIGNNFDYIIVDEFQDTNKIQLDLINELCKNRDITVVGDLNQSIYRFRGAYKDNFKLFYKNFNVNKEDVFNLDKSYRSSNKILRLAHDLILNNYDNKNECFFVENVEGREGENIEIYELKNAREEARKIVELIKRELALGTKDEEICVMFRTHQQGTIIKKALEMERINYHAVSKNSLLKQKAVRKVIYYLEILDRLISKKKGGEEAWWNLIYELKFPKDDLIKIGRFIKQNKNETSISLKLFNELEKIELSENGKMASKILIEKIKKLLPYVSKDVPEILTEIYRIGGFLSEGKTQENKEDVLNLNRFYELCKDHASLYSYDLSSFIYYLDILDSLGIEIEGAELESSGVRLMTLHATKGLEYKTVIITNMCQKRFPIERFNSNILIPLELSPEFYHLGLNKEELEQFSLEYERKHQLMEERRLCYVAFTRAKEKLILTFSREYGTKKFWSSQFLQEVKYKENNDVNFIVDLDEKLEEELLKQNGNQKISDFIEKSIQDYALPEIKPEEINFSPSALLTFSECQKEYEYKYVYNMPEKKTISWEALRLGSFVHLILEKGVRSNFKGLKQFLDYAKELHLERDWEEVDFNGAVHLIKVFYERNKNKYSEKSKTEQILKTNLEGLNFIGFADRIDFNDQGVEIVDYKTGKQNILPLHRNWQLGYYALAASKYGRVKKITLDMLKQEKPLEFSVDEKGNAISVNSAVSFNINDVKEELVESARKVLEAYKIGFKPCPIEKNCEFCNEYVYGL